MFGCAPGVIRTRVGYAGGSKVNPSYHSLGDHTETVDVDYDPSQTNYSNLLKVFWKNHNPTSNCTRQYMSAIFYHDEEQKRLAEETMKEEQKNHGTPITTAIAPMKQFYVAEDYHQKYMLQRHAPVINALDIDPGDELISCHVAARINGYLGGYGSVAMFEKECSRWGISEKTADYIRKQIVSSFRGKC
ncbi:peptide methionine sulfoxide reductase-like [Penaeus japonicus]|uniref:peptide methionine sulfoxide reductase-like n=1 Tax=Penaeus japonicus TaxID=27405 RepID=UPI001C716214|nr:peptide methionine sulfoxide reductase-like [Penaeus japonicus]XP_042882037.1 peptide methionine sulfoxide reductase-like [Penaeus japonicus]XP_042882038.1 peptide methionine sulfoxide reductase-like [Penaeus japonicus]XP_042882039.1 peptide methionine sulfoxide reductase-like [Penaeus japonicus]